MGRPKGSVNKPKTEAGENPPNDNPPRGITPPRSNSWPEGAAIQASLTDTLQGLALGIEWLNKEDGKIIHKGAPKLSEALVDLARKDPRYRKYLEKGSQPGKYGPLLLATSAIIGPIAMNHGLLDGLFTPKKKKDDPVPAAERADGVKVTPPVDLPAQEVIVTIPVDQPKYNESPSPFEDEMQGVPRQSTEHLLLDGSDNLSSQIPEVHFLTGVPNLEGE